MNKGIKLDLMGTMGGLQVGELGNDKLLGLEIILKDIIKQELTDIFEYEKKTWYSTLTFELGIARLPGGTYVQVVADQTKTDPANDQNFIISESFLRQIGYCKECVLIDICEDAARFVYESWNGGVRAGTLHSIAGRENMLVDVFEYWNQIK